MESIDHGSFGQDRGRYVDTRENLLKSARNASRFPAYNGSLALQKRSTLP